MKNNKTVSKSLLEVWGWKESIYNDVKHLSVDQALQSILKQARKTCDILMPTKQRIVHKRGAA